MTPNAVKTFFRIWQPRQNEVLFILFKDGRHVYCDVNELSFEVHLYALCIKDKFSGHYSDMHPYDSIEEVAVGVRNTGESPLSAIPDWFEEKVNAYKSTKEEKNMPVEERNVKFMLEEFDTDELKKEVERREREERVKIASTAMDNLRIIRSNLKDLESKIINTNNGQYHTNDADSLYNTALLTGYIDAMRRYIAYYETERERHLALVKAINNPKEKGDCITYDSIHIHTRATTVKHGITGEETEAIEFYSTQFENENVMWRVVLSRKA